MTKRAVSILVFLYLLLCLPGRGQIGLAQVSDLKPQPSGNPSGLSIDFGSLPLYFTANRGQVDGRAHFYAKAARYTLWLTAEGLVFDSFKPEHPEASAVGKETSLRLEKRESCKYERDVSRLIFLNASKHPEIVPIDETALKVNYFVGNDPAKWHTAVPTSEAVLYKNIYDRIDLKVYGIESRIEYDWIVWPGGDPRNIKFKYGNVKGTRVDEKGNLLVETEFGELMHKKPAAYQEKVEELPVEGRYGNGPRIAVKSAFKKIGENAYGFEIGAYETGLDLIIDPVVLAYSTYLGGGGTDAGYGIAADSSGNAYVTGTTLSGDFPTRNQYQTNQASYDAFVTKLDTTKSGDASLVYSTYLGGSADDHGYGIAVDGSGNAYVTGYTGSTNFPTLNQYQTDPGDGAYDVFVTKLDTTKSGDASLVYSTYLGGDSVDGGRGIAVNGSGNAYVTGYTNSSNFPTLNQYQSDQGNYDAFVTKIDTTKSGDASLVYSTYIGGSGEEEALGIAVDDSGNAYITGQAWSTDFPTRNQYQTDPGDGQWDAFVTKIDTTKSGDASLVYSTYLGGNSADYGRGIAVNGSSAVYVTGMTASTDFPTRNQYQTDPGDGALDVFVTKINTTKSGDASLVYSTYLGGNGADSGNAIAADGSGNAYVTGETNSPDFPTLNQYQTDQADYDAFVTKIDTTQSGAAGLIYSTYLGGNSDDRSYGVAVDSSGNAYAAGYTGSTNFPNVNQHQTDQAANDAFITKIRASADIEITKTTDNLTPKVGEAFNFTVTVTNNGPLGASGLKITDALPATLTYQSADASKGTYTSGTDIWDIGTLAKSATETLTIGVKGTSAGAATNTASVSELNESDPDASNDSDSATVTVKNKLTIAATAGGTTDPVPGTYAYDEGEEVSILATAAAGYRFGSWSGDASGSTNPITVTMNGNKTVTANFIRQYTLSTSAGTGGTIDPAPGTHTYDEGEVVDVTATASADYRFGGWSGDASGTTNPVGVTMDSDKTVTANFIRQYTLTTSAGAGGTTDPIPGTHTYDEGASVSITATASAGYRFGSWSGDASGTISPVSVTMDSDKTVTASFIRQYTLTIATGTGGTTDPAPGTHTYDEGTVVVVTATASAGYRFGSWSGASSGTTNPASVTMDSDKAVTANFIRQYTLTTSAGAGGTTNPVPGTYTYDEGAAVSISATASAGNRFGSWSGDASGTTNPVSVTMNSDKTVTANFVRQYTLTIAAGAGGTTNPSPGTYTYDEGTAVSIQATAASGYRFGSWSGDASGTANPISVTMNGNKTVTADFIRRYTLTITSGVGGTTNPDPGISTYDEGTAVVLTATASAGYRFGSWSGDASGATNPITVTMNGNKTAAASFIRQYTLTITAGANGTTNPAPGTYTYDEGAAVSVQAVPAAAFQLDSWSGDASGTANPVTVAMNGNKAIQANFTRVVKPPLGLTGEKLVNRSVSMVEYVARLRWQPNPANTGTINYRVYRIESGQATAIAEVAAGTYEYIVRGLQATGTYRFGVTAWISQGWESDMVEVVVR